MVTELSPWAELDESVLKSRRSNPQYAIWQDIRRYPLSTYFIDELIDDGWRAGYEYLSGDSGCCDLVSKRILLGKHLVFSPYERDVTLFHELAHARHPDILHVNTTSLNVNLLEIITEWLGRKARADSKLLRHAIVNFGLRPHVYDLSCLKAFPEVEPKPYFVSKVLMD